MLGWSAASCEAQSISVGNESSHQFVELARRISKGAYEHVPPFEKQASKVQCLQTLTCSVVYYALF